MKQWQHIVGYANLEEHAHLDVGELLYCGGIGVGGGRCGGMAMIASSHRVRAGMWGAVSHGARGEWIGPLALGTISVATIIGSRENVAKSNALASRAKRGLAIPTKSVDAG